MPPIARTEAPTSSLIKAVRSLDQGGQNGAQEKLQNLWRLLSSSSGDTFHASEEFILRWLLKNTSGTSPDAERFRLYPLTWAIMAIVFARIPLFTLAKILADRKFITVLNLTANQISKPQIKASKPASEDTEMADALVADEQTQTRERKRTEVNLFELGSQRLLQSCLQSADAVFGALQVLLSRVSGSTSNLSARERIGREHIKSLFCSPANEAAERLGPFMRVCELAVDGQEDELENQESWIRLIDSIWELRLHGNDDPAQATTHLSRGACMLATKFSNDPSLRVVKVPASVKDAWQQDIGRFLIRNTILPARTAFLNQVDEGPLDVLIALTKPHAIEMAPVLWELVLQSVQDDRVTKHKNAVNDWANHAFVLLDKSICQKKEEKRFTSMNLMLEKATKYGVSPFLVTLRDISKEYALKQTQTNWEILARIVECNVDALILGQDGLELAGDLFERVSRAGEPGQPDYEAAYRTLASMVKGFAKARDLAAFFENWFETIAKQDNTSNPRRFDSGVLLDPRLRQVAASLIQSSMTTRRLLELLGFLGSKQEATEKLSQIIILEAISRGISEEAFIDAIQTKIFEQAFSVDLPAICPQAVLEARWATATNTLRWVTAQQAAELWARVKPDLVAVFRGTEAISDPMFFSGLRWCFAAWLSQYPDGLHEEETRSFVRESLSKLTATMEKNSTIMKDAIQPRDNYRVLGLPSEDNGSSDLSWVLHDMTRFASTLAHKSIKTPEVSQGILHVIINGFRTGVLDAYLARQGISAVVNGLHNGLIMSDSIDSMISMLKGDGGKRGWSEPAVKIALQALLDIPVEALTREQRESITETLRVQRSRMKGKALTSLTAPEWKLVLSLMLKMTRKVAYYKGSQFSDMVSLGECLVDHLVSKGESSTLEIVEILRLFNEFSVVAIRQMISNLDDRGIAYLDEAERIISSWPITEISKYVTIRIVLLHSIHSTLSQASLQRALLRQETTNPTLVADKLATLSAAALTKLEHELRKSSVTSEDDIRLIPLFVVLDCPSLPWRKRGDGYSESLEKSLHDMSHTLCGLGFKSGWRLESLLTRCWSLPSERAPGCFIEQLGLYSSLHEKRASRGECSVISSSNNEVLDEYVDAVVGDMEPDIYLDFLNALVAKLQEGPVQMGILSAILRLLQDFHDARAMDLAKKNLVFSTTHSLLAKRLTEADSLQQFIQIVKVLEVLLEKHPSSMTQWNIETTLSSVSIISSSASKNKFVAPPPRVFDWLCRLVKVIITRHRLRVRGHLHLLIVPLQSLLVLLIRDDHALARASQGGSHTAAVSNDSVASHAKAYARLLTLVCEPSVASVTRSQHGSLESATDVAKRAAGQHMYLVLLAYIKLQLEHQVPHAVREALEPGVYSILDITSDQTRRIMSESMDESGRAIFREMIRQYRMFGKWSGV